MPQAIYMDNFFPIADITNWPAVVSKLQWAQGKQIAEHASEMTFDVIGAHNRTEGLWTLTMAEKEGVKGLYAELDGAIKINDPTIGGLRTAEDLATMLIQLRQVNNPGQFGNGSRDIDSVDYFSQSEIPPEGYGNFYQFRDPLTWLELAGKLLPFGDIEQAGTVTIKTSAPHLDTGVYTLTKINMGDASGISVDMDGGPQYNYPKPRVRCAEEIVDTILKLHAMFSTAEPVDRPKFESTYVTDASPKLVVASMKSGETQVKFFANGLITIANPGLIQFTAEDASKLVNRLADVVETDLGK